MTVLKISQETLIQLPAGATGGAVKISYNGTTTGSVIASGDDAGRAVLVSGRLAKLTGLDGASPLQVVGREAGERMPARVTLRIYPEGSSVVAPIVLTGLPVGSPDVPGVWDLSNIDDASGGMDVVTPAERQRLALLMEGASTARVAAETAAQSAGTAEAKANTAIANLNSQVEGAAAQAAAGTVARVDGALADIAQNTALMQQAAGIGRVATEADLVGKPAGAYELTSTNERLMWDGTQITPGSRGAMLAAATATESVVSPILPQYPADCSTEIRTAAEQATSLRQKLVLSPGTYMFELDLNGLDGLYIKSSPGTILRPPMELGRHLFKAISPNENNQIADITIEEPDMYGWAEHFTEWISVVTQSNGGTGKYNEVTHLFAAAGVVRLRLIRPKFRGYCGDGLWLGLGWNEQVGQSPDSYRANDDIQLIDPIFDGITGNNRNPISVYDVKKLRVTNPVFRNSTRSDMPGAVDFEPDAHPRARLLDIKITNPQIENVGGNAGLFCYYYPGQPSERLGIIEIEGGLIDGATTHQDSPNAFLYGLVGRKDQLGVDAPISGAQYGFRVRNMRVRGTKRIINAHNIGIFDSAGMTYEDIHDDSLLGDPRGSIGKIDLVRSVNDTFIGCGSAGQIFYSANIRSLEVINPMLVNSACSTVFMAIPNKTTEALNVDNPTVIGGALQKIFSAQPGHKTIPARTLYRHIPDLKLPLGVDYLPPQQGVLDAPAIAPLLRQLGASTPEISNPTQAIISASANSVVMLREYSYVPGALGMAFFVPDATPAGWVIDEGLTRVECGDWDNNRALDLASYSGNTVRVVIGNRVDMPTNSSAGIPRKLRVYWCLRPA